MKMVEQFQITSEDNLKKWFILRKMDRDLEEQIDDLIHKSTKDLKSRICRLVSRHETKLLKQQARDLKSGGPAPAPAAKKQTAPPSRKADRGERVTDKGASSRPVKKDDKYHSDSDSDGYYSG